MKKAYYYNPETLEYIGSDFCQESPLEKGVYLLPANATFDRPPNAKKGKAVIWHNDTWEYIDDYRGETVYSVQNSFNSFVLSNKMGVEVPDGYTLTAPPDNEKQYIFEAEKWVIAPPKVEDYDNMLENHIRKAREERGYTSREPSEYKGSSVARWAQDAEDFIKFRDECMLYGLGIENDYKAGKSVPTLEEFEKNLPQIKWTYTED